MIKHIINNNLYTLLFLIAALFLMSGIIQLNFIIPLILVFLVIYARNKKINLNNIGILNMSFMFLLVFTPSYFLVRNNIVSKGDLGLYFIPFCVAPMLIMILFRSFDLALLISLATGISVASLSNKPFFITTLFLVSGLSSIVLIKRARKRATIIRVGIAVGIIQVISLLFFERLYIYDPLRYLIVFLNSVVYSIVILGTLPLFEYLFKTVTNISLLELTDSQHPLLQRMAMEAPGTYHHSLVVGNLSEVASEAVGANSLLARIGAYYHDIGKLTKPEYFSENQSISDNKHDDLSVGMSKLVIMNHVKDGIELAAKYRLTPAIVDFIKQHHGNSLVFYFYHRALEEMEQDQDIKEDGFRYPGPKPNTKETAIVLLADSAEAATRALKDPSPARIKEWVHKVINNKFIDGQLDECELTLKDLEKIAVVFIKILSGIYHSRVPYPQEHRSANNHKKSSKENSHLSDKDKEDNS